MNLLDIIGLALALLGLVIFIIVIFLIPRFRQYAGIDEYKDIRKKYLPKKEGSCNVKNVEKLEGGTTLIQIITKVGGCIIALFVGNEVMSGMMTSLAEDTSNTTEVAQIIVSIESMQSFLPLLGLAMIGLIVFDFLAWSRDN